MKRVKRPIPERDAPVRSWAAALGADGRRDGSGAGATNGAAPPHPQDPVVRGVVSGGRVVDEWLRQAQQTARLLGGTGGSAGWADASGRMFRTASDAMAAWWAMLGVPIPYDGLGPGGQRMPDHSSTRSGTEERAEAAARKEAAAAGDAQPGPRMSLHVRSRRPVEVTLNLRTQPISKLQVLDLRPERGTARRIRGPVLEPLDGSGVRLRVAIPDKQPAGTYHAVIVDPQTDAAVGTLTLKVGR